MAQVGATHPFGPSKDSCAALWGARVDTRAERRATRRCSYSGGLTMVCRN